LIPIKHLLQEELDRIIDNPIYHLESILDLSRWTTR